MFIITEFDLISDYDKIYKLVNLSGDIITRITFSDRYKLPKDGTYLINSYGRVCQKIRKKLESVGYIDRNTGFDYMFKDTEIYITKIDLINVLERQIYERNSKPIDMIDLSKYKNYKTMNTESQQALLYLPNLDDLIVSTDILNNKLWQLTKLISLELRFDSGQLSPNIGNLVNLTILDISKCKITELPTTIGLLTKLTYLRVAQTLIKYIPTELGLLNDLTRLVFKDNYIKGVPAEIGNLTKMDNLDLTRNWICILPTELGKLINLTELTLSYNTFISLPAEIGYLTKLKTLISRHGTLTNIPTEIGYLTNMKILNFEDNNISTLPSELGLLKKMTAIRFSGNQLTGDIPDEIKQLRCYKTRHVW